jgi:hypothetical protein
MYCWSCGTRGPDGARYCVACGAAFEAVPGAGGPAGPSEASGPPAPVRPLVRPGSAAVRQWAPRSPLMLRSCPACGFRGEGIPYFRRAGNLALLAAATLFTYGVGGLVYWLLKRTDRVCPSCGLAWDRARPLGEGMDMGSDLLPTNENGWTPVGGTSVAPGAGPGSQVSTGALPAGGGFRRFAGAALGLLGLLLVGLGIVTFTPEAAIVGGVIGLSGGASFGWGWRAQQSRRQALLQRMQREVLRIARLRGGTLTATEVAAEMDVSLPAAERVLLSLDDGFRVTSDVTDDGILVFDFRELRIPSHLQAPRESQGSQESRSTPREREEGRA